MWNGTGSTETRRREGVTSRWQVAAQRMQLFDAVAWLVLGVSLYLVLTRFRDYGVPWDAQGEAYYGALLLKYYASGFRDHSAFEFVNTRFYGGGFDLSAALLARLLPFGPYATRHLLSGVLGVVGLAATWRLARALGGARAGALAIVLLALNPTWYGHAFINARDVPFASGIACCLVLTLRALDELPTIRWSTRVLFGLALGLTLSVRVGGVLGLLFWLVPIALWFAVRAGSASARPQLPRHVLGVSAALLQMLAIAYAVMIALWPWAAQSPANPLRALLMFAHFPFDAKVLFEGRLIPARALPASYLPVEFALRQPEALLVGIVGALLLGAFKFGKRPRALLEPEGLRPLTPAFAAAFPVIYSVLVRPVDYNGMRHFLFIVPPLTALAGLAFDRALQAPSRPLRAVLLLGLAIAAATQARALYVLHPNQYVYFNGIAGGARGAQGRYELDYWGTSLAEATHRLEDRLVLHDEVPALGQPPYRVYVCGNMWSAAAFFPPWLTPVERRSDADFQIAIDTFFCEQPAGSERVLEVTRAGALLSYVDDLRGLAPKREVSLHALKTAPSRPRAR